nr:translation initiation factor IF-2-like [Anser cygnoides]
MAVADPAAPGPAHSGGAGPGPRPPAPGPGPPRALPRAGPQQAAGGPSRPQTPRPLPRQRASPRCGAPREQPLGITGQRVRNRLVFITAPRRRTTTPTTPWGSAAPSPSSTPLASIGSAATPSGRTAAADWRKRGGAEALPMAAERAVGERGRHFVCAEAGAGPRCPPRRGRWTKSCLLVGRLLGTGLIAFSGNWPAVALLCVCAEEWPRLKHLTPVRPGEQQRSLASARLPPAASAAAPALALPNDVIAEGREKRRLRGS